IADRWRFINKKGEIIFTFQADEAGDFYEGLAKVRLGGKWGYIDKSGDLVIATQFDQAEDFSEGLARIKIGDKWGCIENTGKIIRNLQTNEIVGCSEGLTRAEICFDRRYIGMSFIDNTGKIVLFDLLFDGHFAEGLAPVRIYGEWGYVDTNGKIVIAPQYYGAGDFSEGLAPVLLRGKGEMHYIDRTGKIVSNQQAHTATQNQTELGIFYRAGDTLNVLSRSGLELKQASNPDSRTLSVVPYGEQVVVENNSVKVEFEMEGIAGHWVLAKFGNVSGFIFDGFLSKLPAPPDDCSSLESYVEARLGPGKKETIKINTCAEADFSDLTVQKCKWSAVLETPGLWEGLLWILKIPNIRLEEGFLIAKLLWGEMFEHEVFSKDSNQIEISRTDSSGSTVTISIARNQNNQVEIRYSDHM
ncbi:MAG: WG repeat-containing protein, partial [bacterium]